MKALRRALAVVGAAALIAVAGPAWAGISYTGESIGSTPQVQFATAFFGITCDSSTIAGDLDYMSNPTVINIATSTWVDCRGVSGISMSVTQIGTWTFNATGTSGSVTMGTISNVNLRFVALTPAPNPTFCSFDVSGSVDASFDNSGPTLSITGPSALSVSNVSGCFGLVQVPDAFVANASYDLS